MKKFFLKSKEGFVVSDLLVAVLIIALFTGIIATLSYNIYLSTSAIKRHSTATGYVVEIFENVDKLYYSDVTSEDPNSNEDIKGLVEIFNDKNNKNNENNKPKAKVKENKDTEVSWENESYPYKIEILVIPYNEQDLVKTVTVTVIYKVGNKEQKLEVSKVKAKENLITPNAPDLSQITLNAGQKAIPIKYENGDWKTTTKEDTTWYNYDNGYWATVLIYEDEFQKSIGEKIKLTNDSNILLWIPRYAYLLDEDNNITDIKFLYGNTDKIINENGNLESLDIIDVNYIVEQNLEKGKWITSDNSNLNNLRYIRKNIIR